MTFLYSVSSGSIARWNSAVVAQYVLVAAVPAKSSLGRRNEVAVKDLAREGLILFPEGQGLPDRASILDAFRSHGVEPRIVQEASPALAVLSCVSAGVGVALLPECIGFIGFKGVRLCSIQRPNPFPTLALSVIRRSHPRRKIVDRFWQHCLASN
jgi:DNA-binding transcriptional LysR family regulator